MAHDTGLVNLCPMSVIPNHLAGPAIRMCLPSGNWSGLQPSCKYFVNIRCPN